ncbi:two-component system response regulator [Rhodoferax koreense]|uniref:Two-component system response regulator n=1 Tax=Rhodoferax koreensis TaxID=1842727 RepID=A0A1P8JYW2_9BURK|nr:two-component system response regulator [Rhodoferax koreense]APW38938.1 two-component system response regulator [Rhodoferax koreense]
MDEHTPLRTTAKRTVLVVDDTPDNLALMSGLLKDTYRVKLASSGARALQITTARPLPDLILLDIMMPDMDGYEVMRHLRADPETADIPVIFLTAMSASDDEKTGLDMGAVDYITKPINPAIVLARVHNHIELKLARDFLQDQRRLLAHEVQLRTREIVAIQDVTVRAMALLAETRDNETGNHIRRTQHYVRALALALQRHPRFCEELTPDNIDLLFKSAPLHDIGKVGIPDRILLKPGMLEPEEFEIMKTHTTLGHDAIVNAESEQGTEMPFLRFAKEITKSHQEKWDGSGYPEGLIGELIPVSARLMAVADVYDALISRRAYKSAFPHETAFDIIQAGSGSHFDPDVVEAFVGVAEEFRHIAQRYADDEAVLAHQVARLAADMPAEHIELDSKL